MKYIKNPKNEDYLPVLGCGGLRYPKIGNQIDKNKVLEIVKKSYEKGVTFFDTAYSYEGSESALGYALKELGIRENVFVASKLPIAYCKCEDDFDRFFFESLSRLQVEYFDYYFIHALNRIDRLKQLLDWNLEKWIIEKKEQGLIRNLGFSSHASYKEYEQIIKARDWDFSMIQYNYIDENWQAGKKGLLLAKECEIPLFIMEPIRGGMLANSLPQEAKEVADKYRGNDSYAAWALKYVIGNPNVLMVLSGMNDELQIEENCKIANETNKGSISDEELVAYEQAASIIHGKMEVYCTSCGYCMPCPMGVNIPGSMNRLNSSCIVGVEQAKREFEYNEANGRVSNCIGCKACEKKCPQGIDIADNIVKLKQRFLLS